MVAEKRKAVDLTNCDREPIHILGAIQPIGFLIALTSDWMVSRVSANIGDFLPFPADEMLGRSLGETFTPAAIHSLRNRLSMLRGPNAVERIFDCALVMALPISMSGCTCPAIRSSSKRNLHPTSTVMRPAPCAR
jgi:PAS fold